MSLKNRINRLILQANSSKQTDLQLEAKITALQEEFAAMTDDELRAIADGEGSEEFRGMSDRELWEIVARES